MKRIAEAARLQVAEQVEDVDAGRGVEHADDLVGDEQADVEQQRPRDQHALELAAAQLVRVLVEHVARVEVHGLERRAPASPATPTALVPGKYALRIIAKTRSALKIGLYELNGSWKTPCTSRVVVLELPALERRDVDAVEGDRARASSAARRRIIFPIVDLPLPLSPISDDDLAGPHARSETSLDGEQLAAAERAGAVGLAAGVELEHQAAAFQHAAAWPGSSGDERRLLLALRRTRAGSAP